MKKTVTFFVIFVFYQLVAACVVAGVIKLAWPDKEAELQITSLCCSSALASFATLLTFFWTKWCPVRRTYLKSKPYSVLFWAALLALGSIIPSAWFQEMIPDKFTQDIMADVFDKMMKKPEGYLIIGLVAPLVEEVVFRGAILRELFDWAKTKGEMNNKMVWTCIVISALFFAIAHMNPAQIPHAFVIGLLLGWMYWRTGSIIPGIMFHWVNNTAAFVIAGMFPLIPIDAKLAVYFGGSHKAVIEAVIFSLFIALPSLWQLHLLMKKKA